MLAFAKIFRRLYSVVAGSSRTARLYYRAREVKQALISARTLAAFVIVGMLSAACLPWDDNKLIEQGIGTDLYTSGLPEESRRLDMYLGYMCQQGGLPWRTTENDVPECDYKRFGPAGWAIVTRAAFNDIDRRCDAYLGWLNAKRRNQSAALAQFADGLSFTQSLLNVTGSGANAITAAGLAFNLAANTFTNFNSRLLLEVEKSTVESVVHERRLSFRAQTGSPGFQIAFKPDAIHVMREYLLLCTPHNIENSINFNARASIAGVRPAEADNAEQVRRSLANGPVRAAVAVSRPRRVRRIAPGFSEPSRIDDAIAPKIQQFLCVRPVDGKKGPKTAEAIKIFQRAGGATTPSGNLSAVEQSRIINAPGGACNPELRNFSEREFFQNDPTNADKLSILRASLLAKAKGLGLTAGIPEGATFEVMRPIIRQIKSKLGGSFLQVGKLSYLNSELTPEFVTTLF